MNVLTLYPNCSLGGMTSVFLNRCIDKPKDRFTFIFISDKGGLNAFQSLHNSEARIVRKDRLENYLNYTLNNLIYDEIRVTSLPSIPSLLNKICDAKIIYEFHTSSLDIIKKELEELSFDSIDEIWVPSNYLKTIVQGSLSTLKEIKVVRNLANTEVFNKFSTPKFEYTLPSNEIPIFWIGRFDKGKNYKDFFRVLSLLDEKYVGYVILSMENDSSRYAEAIGELSFYGLNDRVKFFLNLSQQEIADLYKSSLSVNGLFCSTSLAESFGYGVLEAAMTGLPVVAYDVGGLSEHLDYNYDIKMVNVGDTIQLKSTIESIDTNRGLGG